MEEPNTKKTRYTQVSACVGQYILQCGINNGLYYTGAGMGGYTSCKRVLEAIEKGELFFFEMDWEEYLIVSIKEGWKDIPPLKRLRQRGEGLTPSGEVNIRLKPSTYDFIVSEGRRLYPGMYSLPGKVLRRLMKGLIIVNETQLQKLQQIKEG